MASTESGRQMYPSFKEAHEAFVAEYTALYQGFPKYLEDRSPSPAGTVENSIWPRPPTVSCALSGAAKFQ